MATEHPEFKNLDAVSLNKLHLDALNPRHDPLNDEDEIIAQLYKSEQVLSLAKDIVAKGALSPLDRTGVVELDGNPGHYVVVEGNRRTCALKLLHDPQKAPDQDSRQAFQNWRKISTFPLLCQSSYLQTVVPHDLGSACATLESKTVQEHYPGPRHKRRATHMKNRIRPVNAS